MTSQPLLPIMLSTIMALAGSLSVQAAEDGPGILEKAGAFYGANPSLAADVVVNLVLPPQMAQMGKIPPMAYRYQYQAPNSLALIPPSGGMAPGVIQNDQKYYTEMTMMGIGILREALPLAHFCTDDGRRYLQQPGADLIIGLGLAAGTPGSIQNLTGVKLAGEEKVDESDCWRLTVDGPEFKGEIWVTQGDQPWVVRITQPAPEPEPSNDQGMMFSPGLDIRISNWEADPEFGDAFTIKPNEDLEMRDAMPSMEEMMALMDSGNSPGGDHPSLDKPAPDVTLHPIGGEGVALADLKGKVVVLDFWATWCKPCVMALPLVAEVAKEMADSDVVFYAVNQRESPSLIESFLDQQSLDIPVALDKNGSTGRAFGVGSIPHSVIIDKKGIVRKVHVGFGPGMGKMLKAEIEELLAK
jgi:thiol-disulfide isomerase/thioredoxin